MKNITDIKVGSLVKVNSTPDRYAETMSINTVYVVEAIHGDFIKLNNFILLVHEDNLKLINV